MNLFKRINRSFYNGMFHIVMCRMHEKGIINSRQMHDICGEWNRLCHPEWLASRGRMSVVQKNIVCRGDVAGGDIIK